MDREFLNRYRIKDQQITRLIEKKEQLLTLATRVTPQLSDMPRGGGKSTEDIYAEMIDIELDINAEIDELAKIKLDICRQIKLIDNITVRKILGYRYIKRWSDKRGQRRIGYSYKYIAKIMGMSKTSILKIHNKAIK